MASRSPSSNESPTSTCSTGGRASNGVKPASSHPHVKDLLGTTALARAMGKSAYYVCAMKAAGYVFEYGTETTLAHALSWRRAHPDFRSSSYRHRHLRQRAPVAVEFSDADAAVNAVNGR